MKTVVTFLIALMSFNVIAQTYTGQVVDKQKLPISYANIVAKSKTDNSLITGVISDENGRFSINPKNENFYLEISFIGFATKKINPTKNNIGTITLKEDGNELEEVIITARKKIIQQKVDRLVFNVENTVAGSGGTVLDALKVTPSVNVDSDKLVIVGKGNVKVMINDRMVQLSGEELVGYLSSIASDDIKNIEVITTPPSKYDAEGNSGLINIQLKKTKENSWSNQIRTSYTQATYPLVNLGNTFNYSKGNISLLASINAIKGHRGQYNDMRIEYPDATWKTTIDMKNKKDMISGRLGIDYKLSDKSTVGILYAGSFADNDISDNGKTLIKDGNGTYLINKGYADLDNTNHKFNAHYIQKLDTLGRKLSIDLDYFNFKNPLNRNFSSQRFMSNPFYFEAENISNQDIKNYSGKIDIEHPTKWAKFSYGGKITSTKTKNNVAFYNKSTGTSVLDPTQSNEFDYTENIQALYIDFVKPLSKKWQTKIGLRLENTQTKGVSKTTNQTNENNYAKLFPSMFFGYNANASNQFNISYSRRIQRPYFQSLNPFRFYINSISYQEGNPFLKPQISDNFELKHTYKRKLISKVFVSYIDDGFTNIIKVDNITKKQIVTVDNFYTAYNYGISETFLYSPAKWWNTMSQVTLSTIKTSYKKGFNLDAELLNGLNFQLYNKNTFFLNSSRTVQAEATVIYASPQKMMYFETSSMFGVDLGLKMQFLNKKLICTISANDIFRKKAVDIYTKTNGINQKYNTYMDSRNFKIGISYRFGNDKIRVKKHNFGNQEEQGRAN